MGNADVLMQSFQFCSLLAGVREIHVEHSREHELPATGNVNRDIIIMSGMREVQMQYRYSAVLQVW